MGRFNLSPYIREEIIFFIPARGGSKSIKKKNLVRIKNLPLIGYTLECLKKLNFLNKTYVSTDCNEIKSFVKKYDVNIHNRSKSLSRDKTKTSEVIRSFLEDFKIKDSNSILILQPTSPLRSKEDIINAIKLFLKYKKITIISANRCPWSFLKCSFKIINKKPKYLFKTNNGIRRQDLEEIYVINGAIYLFSIKNFKKNNYEIPKNFEPYYMPYYRGFDLDDYDDLRLIKKLVN